MKNTIVFILMFLVHYISLAQPDKSIISKVVDRQRGIQNISYEVIRKDTLLTGDIRTMSGKILMYRNLADTILGYTFYAQQPEINERVFYNGHIGYLVNDGEKTYTTLNESQYDYILNISAGRLLMTDILSLDTTGTEYIESEQNNEGICLIMHYPDIPKYNVYHRYKKVFVDPTSFLPWKVISHQVSNGQVQCLSWTANNLKWDMSDVSNTIARPDFLSSHKFKITDKKATPLSNQFIGMDLTNLKGYSILDSTEEEINFLNHLTLLDFWAIWCGPCIESLPKVERLSSQYSSDKLEVFGVILNDKQLEPTIRFIKSDQGPKFNTIAIDVSQWNKLNISALPLYLLVDTKGKVIYSGFGYTQELEEIIKNRLEN
ncbi:MAG: TlpA family protein disulfide reductase [Saprospiraceae bacterium]|nr:TlpA family protein disulfide reductase [Saprospiraceae bacterium]